jgi:hypothetical protein
MFGFLTRGDLPKMQPVGRAHVPLRAYLQLITSFGIADAFESLPAQEPDAAIRSIADGMEDLLTRAAESVEVAMGDRYHWTRLQSGLLPVEPEILAATILASAVAGPRLGDFLDVPPVAAVPLRLGQMFAAEMDLHS